MDEAAVEPVDIPDVPHCAQNLPALAGKINLPDFQDAVPVARELTPLNETDIDFKALGLTVSFEPALFKPKTWHTEHSVAGRTIRIRVLDLLRDGALLGQFTEVDREVVAFRLTVRQEPSNELAPAKSTVELLLHNHCGGPASLSGSVAAFVQPTEPAVEPALEQAAAVLRQAGKSGSIHGYQGRARRTREFEPPATIY